MLMKILDQFRRGLVQYPPGMSFIGKHLLPGLVVHDCFVFEVFGKPLFNRVRADEEVGFSDGLYRFQCGMLRPGGTRSNDKEFALQLLGPGGNLEHEVEDQQKEKDCQGKKPEFRIHLCITHGCFLLVVKPLPAPAGKGRAVAGFPGRGVSARKRMIH